MRWRRRVRASSTAPGRSGNRSATDPRDGLNSSREGPSMASTIPAARRRRPLGGQARAEERAAYTFLAPWLIGLVVFLVAPLAWSIYISLSDEQLLRPGQF